MSVTMTTGEPLPLHYHPETPHERKVAFIARMHERAGEPGWSPVTIARSLGLSDSWYYATRKTDPDFRSDTDDIMVLNRELRAEEAENIITGFMRGDFSDDGRPDYAAAKFMLQHLNSTTYGQKVDHQHSGTIILTVPSAQRLDKIIDVAPASPAIDASHIVGVPEDPTIPIEEWEEEDE